MLCYEGIPELADLIEIGGGEGFSLYTATFDGRPAIVVDCGTMADLLEEGDAEGLVHVQVFDNEAARDAQLAELQGKQFTGFGELPEWRRGAR